MGDCAIGVVAHEARRRMALELAEATHAKVISIDGGTRKCGGNHRHVWTQLAQSGQAWLCVLEDDAVPVVGFLEQFEAALTCAPEPIVSLYLGRDRPPQYQKAIERAIERADADPEVCWIVAPRLYQAVGVAMVAELVADMVTYTARKAYFPIDDAIASWALRNSYRVAHTWPSLVEHRDGPSVAHTFRPAGRVAWRTGVRDAWTDIAITMQE